MWRPPSNTELLAEGEAFFPAFMALATSALSITARRRVELRAFLTGFPLEEGTGVAERGVASEERSSETVR